ncbi:hypothetical protein [Rhizobium sp. Root651]|uniref:hypothetical protein n=1 Tax=Rhizobium sp. Root651 TaxID=1736577 RepID=UPI000715565B|nr:hypothetical protein [Rhizobium sp. Root651]KRA65264.1 hypothetical protein ASD85_25220 [Rhizobium sp. Root651]
MKLYQPGDTSRAICPHCGKLVSTTFAYRDVPFEGGSGVVKGILAAVCDECQNVIAIPAQSTPAIRRARDAAEISLEVSIPAPEVEILDAAAYRVDPSATTRFRKSLFAFYLQRLRHSDQTAEMLRRDFEAWNAVKAEQRKRVSRGIRIPHRRLSFKISPKTERDVQWLMETSGMNKTDTIRSVVMEIEKDLLGPKAPRELRHLQDIAAVVNA